jgi:hypothetical protein
VKEHIKYTLTRRELATLAGATALSLVPGCGSGAGGDSVRGRGALLLTIHWPASRAIPAETRSIRLKVLVLEPDEGLTIVEKVVARPAGETLSQTVIDRVPSVKVRVAVTAHRTTDGAGDVLASGAAEVRVTENSSTPVSVTLGSITRVEIRPASLSVEVNQSIQLSAHAFDGQGNEVTVAPTSWQWSITPGTVARIAPNGNAAQVTGLVEGGAIASVVLSEAGLSASRNVAIGTAEPDSKAILIGGLKLLGEADSALKEQINVPLNRSGVYVMMFKSARTGRPMQGITVHITIAGFSARLLDHGVEIAHTQSPTNDNEEDVVTDVNGRIELVCEPTAEAFADASVRILTPPFFEGPDGRVDSTVPLGNAQIIWAPAS